MPSAYIPIFFHQTDFYSCFDVLNKLKFSITLVCLRLFSLNTRILHWMLSILIEQYFEKVNVGVNCFVTKMISKLICFGVKNLDVSIFVGVPSAYIAIFFIKLIFVSCFDVLNNLKFSITLVCLWSVSLNQKVLNWTLSILIEYFEKLNV